MEHAVGGEERLPIPGLGGCHRSGSGIAQHPNHLRVPSLAQRHDSRAGQQAAQREDLLEVLRRDGGEAVAAVGDGFDGAVGHERHHRLAHGTERHAQRLRQSRGREDPVLAQVTHTDGRADLLERLLAQRHARLPSLPIQARTRAPL